MFLDMIIGETPNDTWTLNFGEINHKPDVAIPKHFALELLKIKEEMKGLRKIAETTRNNLNMLRYFHLDYTGGPTDSDGNRPKQPIYRHDDFLGPCITCDDLIAGEKALEALDAKGGVSE